MIETTRKCDGGCGDNSPHNSHLTDAGEAAYSISPALFDSVPVTIAAICWLGGAGAATGIINWILQNGGTATWDEGHVVPVPENVSKDSLLNTPIYETEGLYIQTLEGRMKASPGDWIIRGTEGEFYPCKPSVFERKYKNYVPQEIKEKS